MQTSARARVRAELISEMKRAARRQLAEHGSAELSLRALARDLGMVSSAVYRYFPSRDDLLAALVADAYDALNSAAEAAESAVRRGNLLGRWLAVATATRDWALAQPHEYALVFGSPVPGYHPPDGTIDPTARIPSLLARIVTDAVRAGRGPAANGRPTPRAVRSDLRALRDSVAPVLSEPQLAYAMLAWTQLVGSVSFELFGQLRSVVNDHQGLFDYQGYFDYQMQGVGQWLGLTERARKAQPASG